MATTIDLPELAVLGALSAARIGLPVAELAHVLERSGISGDDGLRAVAALLARGEVTARRGELDLTEVGSERFLELHASLEAALDITAHSAVQEDCPSVPWLTTVQTCWIDALSINYAVEPAALAKILPAPLEPEVFRGSAWVQILMSSLRDMRPQGLTSLFGVCFYQVSYRAAVQFRSVDGSPRRGGYFVRSETNHPVMRAIGNRLNEFKFHAFGAAEMVMLRSGDALRIGVDPEDGFPHGKLVGHFDTRPLAGPPAGSIWTSVEDLQQPLIECYDALGVDQANKHLYILTIDRDPWNPAFIHPVDVYSEYFDTGPLGGGVARFDSVLHFRECAYRWRPLRREPLPG